MRDDVLRSDRKLLSRLAGLARAERVELRLTQNDFGHRVELTVERGVRQDVTSGKFVFQNKSFIIIGHTLTNMGLVFKNLLLKVKYLKHEKRKPLDFLKTPRTTVIHL